jgi:AAA ATPase domain
MWPVVSNGTTGQGRNLRRCLVEWNAQGRVDEFVLGQNDTPNRLLIPEKLYGRAQEINRLSASFDRVVASGRTELVLVSGYSGIGKSSAVNELHKVLVPPRGLFASGKFDQYKRDIPYATLALQRLSGNAMLQRRAFQIFHCDERMITVPGNFVDGANVRMVQG